MTSIIDQDSIRATQPRKPVIAALLSLIPGLGQIYNGQVVKGIVFLLIDILIPVLFGISGVLLNIDGLVAIICVTVAFIVYRVGDGFVVAKRRQDYELKPSNRVYVYILFTILSVGVKILLDIPTSAGIETFRITSPSMAPTLVPDDRVVAHQYKEEETIQYGDIVVYNSPKGGVWTSRVIALPLDSVEVTDGIVSINKKRNQVKQIKAYTLYEYDVIEFQEELANNKKIRTLRSKDNIYPEGRTMATTFVPENEYFLMSDNRDDALDSRFMGPIKREDILGRVAYRYWPNSSDSEIDEGGEN